MSGCGGERRWLCYHSDSGCEAACCAPSKIKKMKNEMTMVAVDRRRAMVVMSSGKPGAVRLNVS